MKKLLPFLAVVLALGAIVFARDGVETAKSDSSWLTDPDAAMAKARTEGKILLMDFTGSDWCVWCQRLDAEVFSKSAFTKFAEENLVLLKLDFPRKSDQSDDEKQRNRALAEKYEIQGFPTVLVFSPAGKKLGELGYQRGGPDAWIASLQELKGS